jgi:hypothetical protein
MIINKITVGFVIQKFDDETGKFISQEFIAGDEVTYEDAEYGEEVNSKKAEKAYFPFDMIQP